MKKWIIVAGAALLAHTPAQAIDATYRQQLERSGCTQVSEAQGCDLHKTKEENAKAGFISETQANKGHVTKQTPYAGHWVAKGTAGATVATIRVDNQEQVWVNGKTVKAKRRDGALVFKAGTGSWTRSRTFSP